MEIGKLLQAIGSQAWAIDPLASRPLIRTALTVSANEQARRLNKREDDAIARQGAVAMIPIHGTMVQRASGIAEVILGLTSTDRVAEQLRMAAADNTFSAIMLHVDSPGGMVHGTPELAAAVREAKAAKPVIAQVDSVAASAAYWVASQASEIVVTPSGDVGSIGVLAMHEDLSQALTELGVNISIIQSAPHKAEGNPFEPLSDEAKAEIQSRMDEAHRAFVADVAAGRETDRDTVESDFGQGRMLSARKALKAGMADRIATFAETVSRFQARGDHKEDRGRRARLAQARATT